MDYDSLLGCNRRLFRLNRLLLRSFDFMQLQTRVSKGRARRGRCRSRPARSTWRSTRLRVSFARVLLGWGRWKQGGGVIQQSGAPRRGVLIWDSRCGRRQRHRMIAGRRHSARSRRARAGVRTPALEARIILLAPGYDARSCIPVRQPRPATPATPAAAQPPPSPPLLLALAV